MLLDQKEEMELQHREDKAKQAAEALLQKVKLTEELVQQTELRQHIEKQVCVSC